MSRPRSEEKKWESVRKRVWREGWERVRQERCQEEKVVRFVKVSEKSEGELTEREWKDRIK